MHDNVVTRFRTFDVDVAIAGKDVYWVAGCLFHACVAPVDNCCLLQPRGDIECFEGV